MPNQGKIINAVNLCLKQKGNIDFEFNKTGVCAGLTALYVKYALENRTSQFFSLLDELATLPSDYRLGVNPTIDNFIIQIEKAFRPSEYSGYEIQQGDLEKILHSGNKPLTNEFNLGLTTDESSWKEIFKKIGRNNRSYFITSKNHAIALSFQNGKYIVYDPNYNKKTKEFTSVDELITEIKDCFEYNTNSFGLVIRTFANPKATPEHYPTHDELHQIAFAKQVDESSSTFAAIAGDINTLKYLFKENKINYDLLAKEYLRPEFNDLLLKQPKSTILKNALLRGISGTLYVGNQKEAEKLIDHYLQTYTATEEQNELKGELQKLLSEPVKKRLILMKKESNYSKLLNVFDQFNLSQNPDHQTHYNHLQLLTFVKQEVRAGDKDLFLRKLSPEQVIKQIQCAAITNQHHVLNLLIDHVINAKIDPKSFPSIFNKDVIEEINTTTLLRLLEKDFVINTKEPDLLSICMQRKDKSIFEAYARAWSEQTNRPELWKHIDHHEYHLIDLNTSLGSASLINALIFLRKNEHVKRAWKDDSSEEMIKSALTIAILIGNKEMSLFLQEKLRTKKNQLESDTLEFLYKKGLEEEDLSILSILTQLNFNVLHNTQDIRTLFKLCYDYEDFSIIESCFEKASPKIKQLILEYSLNWNIMPALTICIQKEPQLFNAYLNESTTKPDRLTKLNRVVMLLPPNTLSLQLDTPAQKKFVKYCFKNKLPRLAKLLCEKVAWEEAELNEFINELIQEKHENGIILLLQIYPKLKEKPELTSLLVQNNLLNPLDFLLTANKTLVIDHNLTEQIFTAAIANDHKNLVARFLNQGRITPQTILKQPLTTLLKQAIVKGNDSVLDPFIQSNLDFGLDFKELFLFSCAQKQVKIANQILAKEFILTDRERQSTIKQLFGEQPASVLFENVYVQGYGRLYQLLLKANIQNPRAALLSSIQNPKQDLAFQQTDLYLNPLKRAIKEKNEHIFNTLFTQSSLPGDPDNGILSFLKDPVLFSSVFHLFVKKYSLKALLTEALRQKEWAVLGNLIEKHKLSDLDVELHQSIQEHGMEIVKAYMENLEAHYDKTDVRPQLFKLLDDTNTHALAQLAIHYRESIQTTLERIELNMLKNQLDLNYQIYRYTLSNLPFKKALVEIGKIFEECQKTIRVQEIDLSQFIESQEIINNLAQIKTIMEGHDIAPDYLPEEYSDLFEKLIENSRFKSVCQLEFKLYCLLKQFQKPLSEQSKTNQEEFNKAIKSLHESLEQTKLPISFVLPIIQTHLKSYQATHSEPKIHAIKENEDSSPQAIVQIPANNDGKKSSLKTTLSTQKEVTPSSKQTKSNLDNLKSRCTNALKYYLKHRDETLSIFSYYFDYYRGQIRAKHYKNLINSAKTENELYVIEYAILVNGNGTQLKKDMAKKLKYKDENNAQDKIKALIQKSHSEENLEQLDKVIDSINQKINANDDTATDSLFHDELDYLKQTHAPKSSLTQNSLFQPKKQKQQTAFWSWIASWFGFDSPTSDQNRLFLKK